MSAPPHRRTACLTAVVALTAFAALGAPSAAPAATSACRYQGLVPTHQSLPKIRQATRCLINHERRKRARPALRTRGQLRTAGQRHAGTMVRQRFFGHLSPAGHTPLARIQRTRYARGPIQVGENLAWGSEHLATPAQTVAARMRSPGHRRNVLAKHVRHVGIGVAIGAPADLASGSAATYAAVFANRR